MGINRRLLYRNIDTVRQADNGISLLGDVSHVNTDLVGAGGIGHIDLAMFYTDRGNPEGSLDLDSPILGKGVTADYFVSLFDDNRPPVAIGDQLKSQKSATDKGRRQQNKDDVAFLH